MGYIREFRRLGRAISSGTSADLNSVCRKETRVPGVDVSGEKEPAWNSPMSAPPQKREAHRHGYGSSHGTAEVAAELHFQERMRNVQQKSGNPCPGPLRHAHEGGGQKQRTGYQTGVTQPEKYPFARFYLQARQQQGRRLKTHACEARHDRPHRNTAHLPDESGGRNGRFQRRLAGSAPRRNDGSQQGPAHSAYGGG